MDKEFTRLTLEQGDRKITWEVPHKDVSGEDMMEALNTIMVGMTFLESTVQIAMHNYLTEMGFYDKMEEENGQED